MRAYTAHLAPHGARHRAPVLLPEAFSWGAFLFGPVWLLLHRAWIPAVLLAAGIVVLATVVPAWLGLALLLPLVVLTGVLGRDWVRWSLERRGYRLDHVLAARDSDAAFARLLAARPDLVPELRDAALEGRAL